MHFKINCSEILSALEIYAPTTEKRYTALVSMVILHTHMIRCFLEKGLSTKWCFGMEKKFLAYAMRCVVP